MLDPTEDGKLVKLTVRVYRFLLTAYPREFREGYGEDMQQVFLDQFRRAYRQNNLLWFWIVTLLDWSKSLIEEHIQKETNMSKSTFIRISGWAMVLGALAFFYLCLIAYLDMNNPLLHLSPIYGEIGYFAGLYAGTSLFALGLLGLRARYKEALDDAGKNVLLIGAIFGPLFTAIGIFGGDLAPGGPYEGVGEILWGFLLFGPIVQMFALIFFGIDALRKKPLPRWNGLPLLAGIGFPFLPLVFMAASTYGGKFPWYLFAGIVLQFLFISALGFILQGDAEMQEMEMAAA
jgi:hypothetical protein